jgi:putative endonuclease
MHYVYILRCADECWYVGETADPYQRMADHQEGSARAFTSRRRPVELAHLEQFATRGAALERERQLKRWTRAKKEPSISGNLALLKRL